VLSNKITELVQGLSWFSDSSQSTGSRESFDKVDRATAETALRDFSNECVIRVHNTRYSTVCRLDMPVNNIRRVMDQRETFRAKGNTARERPGVSCLHCFFGDECIFKTCDQKHCRDRFNMQLVNYSPGVVSIRGASKPSEKSADTKSFDTGPNYDSPIRWMVSLVGLCPIFELPSKARVVTARERFGRKSHSTRRDWFQPSPCNRRTRPVNQSSRDNQPCQRPENIGRERLVGFPIALLAQRDGNNTDFVWAIDWWPVILLVSLWNRVAVVVQDIPPFVARDC